ncbi:MAG: hypothetical protein ABIA02_00305, partial [Candidatus Falkowbacteria bacterium]
MSQICQSLQSKYKEIKTLNNEFVLAFEKAKETRTQEDRDTARKLMNELKSKREELKNMLWPFEKEIMSMQEFKKQYQKTIEAYRHFGFLQKLSDGQEGIKDEQGNEHPVLSIDEIKSILKENKETVIKQMESMENPIIHLTPFALSPEYMKDKYSDQIEEHFVEERIEGDKRIPNKDKTKLFGVDGEPLELRADKQNVYFDNVLKDLTYFPEWKKQADNSIKPENGITKEQAIKEIGIWRIIITENIPLAPEKDQGEKEIIGKDGKTKKIKQVEGGMDASQQYEFIKKQDRQGLTPEDWISFAMLYLRKNNTVLDDDQKTNYYCRLLGAATASG